MKIVRSEFGHDYGTYRFGYCEHLIYEGGDHVAEIYERGFLPYSADPTTQNRFYMARSARVPLKEFVYTSENRRIAKRFDGLCSVRTVTASEAKENQHILALFVEYFAQRHGKDVMSKARLEGILSTSLPLRVQMYEKEGFLIAAVLEVAVPAARHFWFSAYDLSYAEQSLGMWLMLDAARQAKEEGVAHYYVGTAYGPKALYKTNLEPLEFWNGSEWSRDIPHLKKLARAES